MSDVEIVMCMIKGERDRVLRQVLDIVNGPSLPLTADDSFLQWRNEVAGEIEKLLEVKK